MPMRKMKPEMMMASFHHRRFDRRVHVALLLVIRRHVETKPRRNPSAAIGRRMVSI
jgi:hypothetical protein